MTEAKYQQFLDSLNQFAQDQKIYESDLLHQDEYKGIRHEEIIKLGNIMCKRLTKFAEKGETFMEDLPSPNILPNFIDAITSYQLLIVPPKVFGGFCPCLKPARDGPEYDRKFFLTKAKMVSAIFVSYAILIQHKADEIVSKSSHFDVYVDDMNKVFTSLSEIKCSNNEPKHLENIRRKLTVSLEGVDRFIQLHGERSGKPEFKTEAIRSLKKVQDLLTVKKPQAPVNNPDGTPMANVSGGSVPIGRRILIKAQSTLQEIMNSAAAISATEAKEQIEVLDGLSKTLKKSRESELAQFNSMEEQMTELSVSDALNRLREDSEVIHSDANSKVKECIKRWKNIKNKSSQRKVAEYTEEGVSSFNPITINSGNPIKQLDNPKLKQLAKQTTERFDEFGKKTKDVFDTAGNEMLRGITKVTKESAGAVKKVGNLLTGENISDGSSHGDKETKSSHTSGGVKLTNPFEGVMGGGGSTSSQTRGGKKGGKSSQSTNLSKFNPLDAF